MNEKRKKRGHGKEGEKSKVEKKRGGKTRIEK